MSRNKKKGVFEESLRDGWDDVAVPPLFTGFQAPNQSSSPFETCPRAWRVVDEARAMESPIRRRPAIIKRSADRAAAAVPLIIHQQSP